MKFSKYTLFKEGYPQDDYILMYNTLTKGVSVINSEDYQRIGTIKESEIQKEHLQLMKEEGFIVDNTDDERSKLNMFFTSVKCEYYTYSTMILTSYSCNMSCPYCFENKIKNNKNTMSEKTAYDVVTWLKKELIKYQPKNSAIVFSGGEPLYNKEAVKIIITEMKKFCDDIGIGFLFGFLTNGTIEISDEEARLFKKCGINFFQYTIDGSEAINDSRRVIEGGSYRKIFANIVRNHKLMDMQTIVRVNVDKDNAESIEEMLDDLKALNIDNLTLDYAVRFETPCDIYSSNASVLSQKGASETIKKCLKITRQKGLEHSRRFTSDSPCLAIVPRQFVIDPIGNLYKCAAFAGEEDYVVGSIYNDYTNEKYIDIVGNDAWHDCKDCKYVPLCAGGCLLLNRNASGDYKKRVCQHLLFDNLVLETLISTLDKNAIIEQLRELETSEDMK